MWILLLLAVWGGAGGWWFLSRPEGHSTDSIGMFRQQLRVLERTGPTTVAAAYRMDSEGLGVYGASRIPTMSGPGRALANNPSVAAARRRRVQKRRRDVFFALAAAVAGSAVVGFVPGMAVLWWLSVLLGAALMVYVMVLIQLRAAAVERTQKVRYLPTAAARASRPAEPAYLLRRSAN